MKRNNLTNAQIAAAFFISTDDVGERLKNLQADLTYPPQRPKTAPHPYYAPPASKAWDNLSLSQFADLTETLPLTKIAKQYDVPIETVMDRYNLLIHERRLGFPQLSGPSDKASP